MNGMFVQNPCSLCGELGNTWRLEMVNLPTLATASIASE